MRLEGVELRLLDLSLRRPVMTAAGEHRRRPVVVARVVTDVGEGWGECGALADGTAVDPSAEVAWKALTGPAVDRLTAAARARGGAVPPAAQVASLFDAGPVGRMVAATVEMAVLDVELRVAGTPLWRRLGVDEGTARRGVAVGGVVGIPADRSPVSLVTAVSGALEQGAARVRCKIEPGWDAVPLRAVRETFPDVVLQADANGSYRWGSGDERDASALDALDELGLACVEQPLPAADLAALAALAHRLVTPVCLDESLTSLRRLADALRYGACRAACCKPARLGGLLAARRAQEQCLDAAVPAFVGGLFETGLARTANAALAGLPGFTWPGDLSDPAGYLEGDPFSHPGSAGGRVRLPDAGGVGSRPDASRLAAVSSEVVWRRAGG